MADHTKIPIQFDPTIMRLSGVARHGMVPFDAPFISHILDNLWMGGCPRTEVPDYFKFIICLYPWERYHVHEHQVLTQVQMFDSGKIPDVALLEHLADMVNSSRAIGPTLVHCQAGLNRSGLVAALALVKAGKKPQEAISELRAKRCDAVLCNKAFAEWLTGDVVANRSAVW